MRRPPDGHVVLRAPAKLTLGLRVTGVRADGYHLLDTEMVTVDLADTLTVRPGRGLRVAVAPDARPPARSWSPVPDGPANLVSAALAAVGGEAAVDLVKRIPPGGGLGGGSADAAAVLRWAGCTDPAVAAALGADVPFCVAGGRARVRGVGEVVEPLAFEDRRYTLVLLPLAVDTAAVYRAWDRLAAGGAGPGAATDTGSGPGAATDTGPGAAGSGPDGSPGGGAPAGGPVNDLEAPALDVEPRLGRWRALLEERTGRPPHLAGSGSTWYFEGTPDELGLDPGRPLHLDGEAAWPVAVRTVPPGWPADPAPPQAPAPVPGPARE